MHTSLVSAVQQDPCRCLVVMTLGTVVQILRVPGGVSEQEEVQVQVTRLLVESYFDVVRKNLQDAVPKAVMHFLVNSVQRGLQQHLIRSLYRYSSCTSGWSSVMDDDHVAHVHINALREPFWQICHSTLLPKLH